MFCGDEDCATCEANHEDCQTVKLKKLTTILKKKQESQKDFLLDMCNVDNKFIKEMLSARIPLSKQHRFGQLDHKEQNIIEDIYVKGNSNCMKGKEAN